MSEEGRFAKMTDEQRARAAKKIVDAATKIVDAEGRFAKKIVDAATRAIGEEGRWVKEETSQGQRWRNLMTGETREHLPDGRDEVIARGAYSEARQGPKMEVDPGPPKDDCGEGCEEEAPAFAVGNVVMLRSGGPKMTVAAIHEIGAGCWCGRKGHNKVLVCCSWFDVSSGDFKSLDFLPDVLRREE